jgi:hypothetical protein
MTYREDHEATVWVEREDEDKNNTQDIKNNWRPTLVVSSSRLAVPCAHCRPTGLVESWPHSLA